MYCEAVTEVHITWDQVPAAIYDTVFSDWKDNINKQVALRKYDPELCRLLTRAIRKKCAAVRRICYGTEDESWIVHCDPKQPCDHVDSPKDRPLSPQADTGHVEVISTEVFTYPSTRLLLPDLPKSPSAAYGIQHRSNLSLRGPAYPVSSSTSADSEEWLKSHLKDPFNDNLYKRISSSRIPVALVEFTSLYERQIAKGHVKRLERIDLPRTLSFSIVKFNTFARVAAASITQLILASAYRNNGVEDRLSFRDLPALVTIVRETLPNLAVLHLSMSGIHDSEKVCGEMLSADSLELRGTITDLRIFTLSRSYSPFNALRCLSLLCAETFFVHVGMDTNNSVTQADYLRQLRG